MSGSLLLQTALLYSFSMIGFPKNLHVHDLAWDECDSYAKLDHDYHEAR